MKLVDKNLADDPSLAYEKVILYRTDLVAPSLPDILMDIQPNTIYFPAVHIFNDMWINMAMLFSDCETMRKYCSLFPLISQYIYFEFIMLHSETLATYHVMKQEIKQVKIDYNYELHANRRN